MLLTAREELIVVFDARLTAIEETDKISSDSRTLLADLLDLVRREEASFIGVSLAIGAAMDAIEDEEIIPCR